MRASVAVYAMRASARRARFDCQSRCWSFGRFFLQTFASLWRQVLAHNDRTLGLHPHCGKLGGYRPRLIQMLQQWEGRCNLVLQQQFDALLNKDEVLRVHIVSVPRDADLSSFASSLDTDWSYDQASD